LQELYEKQCRVVNGHVIDFYMRVEICVEYCEATQIHERSNTKTINTVLHPVAHPSGAILNLIKKIASAKCCDDKELYKGYIVMPEKPTKAKRTLKRQDAVIEQEDPDFSAVPSTML
jgi:hypothetical protein